MTDLAHIAGGIGAALTIIGAAYGISRLGATALDGGARQPEVAGHLRISMIIAAALIEGLGFFALVICLLLALKPVAAEAGGAGASHEPAAPTAMEHPGLK
ncbi:MAG: ATP synthase F0 subunit C [Planctomycetota bacterium]|jgi:F-type H+-transporting ATPase subunit c